MPTCWASLGQVVGGVMEEVKEEWAELTTAVRHVVHAGQDAAVLRAKAIRMGVVKAVHGHPPSWEVLSLGAITTVALLAMGSLLMANHKLAQEINARDKELARLVLRIMDLQESLQSRRAASPIIRLTALRPAFAISSLA